MKPSAYIKQATRTKSDRFFPVLVPPSIMQVAVTESMVAGNLVDTIKKALFYGKPYQAPQRLINAAASMPEALAKKGFNFNAVPVDIQHSVLGIFSEAAELMQAVGVAAVDGEELDLVNLDEEMGDLLWYLAIYCQARETTFENLMAKNIAKLRTRFPDRFTTGEALNRDLDAEREALTDG